MDDFLANNERRAYRMAFIATGNRDDAMEIVQDAMLKLVTRYSNKPDNEWGPLFYRIVQSTIRDWYRRSKIRNSLRMFFGSHSESNNNPLDMLENTQQAEPDRLLKEHHAMEALDQALHKLPLRQQQAFLLRQWEGLNVNETANAMSCSEGSVKTHLSRAIAALRNALEDHWP